MTSSGYDPRQSPGLGYKRVVSCKDSFHGTDVLAVSEHGAPGRRPNIHAHFVGRQREDGLDTLPARAAEANRSTLIADIPFPAPGNVAAKRCASEKRSPVGDDEQRQHSPASRPPTSCPHPHRYPQTPELHGMTRSRGCGRQKTTVYPSAAGEDPNVSLFDGVVRASRRAHTHLVRATPALTSPIVCS